MCNKECPIKRIVKSMPVKVTIGIVAGTAIAIAALSEIALIGCRKKKQKEEIDKIRQQIALKDASMMSVRRMCEKLDDNDKQSSIKPKWVSSVEDFSSLYDSI